MCMKQKQQLNALIPTSEYKILKMYSIRKGKPIRNIIVELIKTIPDYDKLVELSTHN